MAYLLGSGVARAEPTAQGELGKLIDEANRAAAEGRLDESRRLWRIVWDAYGDTTAACNIGQLSSRIGDPVTAVEFLPICVEKRPEFHAGRLELARAQANVARLTIQAPEGARIFLDGKAISRPRGPVPVKPGVHHVEAELGGRRGKSAALAAAGETLEVVVDIPAPPCASPARPVVQGPTWPLVAGIVGSGLGMVAGGTLLALADAQRDSAERRAQAISPSGCVVKSPECDDVRDAATSFFHLRIAAIGVFVGAGMLGIGTAVYAVLRPDGAAVAGTW
jgi:hypothetical protein